MYRVRYAIAAAVRFVLFYALRPLVKRGEYEAPNEVPTHKGYYELPVVGVIVFERTDHTLQFYW